MDKSASEITFDENGVCNFCHQALKELGSISWVSPETAYAAFFDEIKKSGDGKKYNCLIGLSGGVDSSYVLHRACKKVCDLCASL